VFVVTCSFPSNTNFGLTSVLCNLLRSVSATFIPAPRAVILKTYSLVHHLHDFWDLNDNSQLLLVGLEHRLGPVRKSNLGFCPLSSLYLSAVETLGSTTVW
jgi:hypothetical protein